MTFPIAQLMDEIVELKIQLLKIENDILRKEISIQEIVNIALKNSSLPQYGDAEVIRHEPVPVRHEPVATRVRKPRTPIFSDELIRESLIKANGKRSEAAKIVGMTQSGFWNRCNRMGLFNGEVDKLLTA